MADTDQTTNEWQSIETAPDAENRPAAMCDCERGHNGFGMVGRECDCCPMAADVALLLLRTTADRMQSRVDAIVERDGSVDAAVTGRGVGISYLFARNIVRACTNGERKIEMLLSVLQDVVDDMTFCVGPSKGTIAKINEVLPKAKAGPSLLRPATTAPDGNADRGFKPRGGA